MCATPLSENRVLLPVMYKALIYLEYLVEIKHTRKFEVK